MIINTIAVVAGGLFSLAFVAPRPWCYMAALAAACGVMLVRSI